MTPERWEQVNRICHAAIEVGEGERRSFLEAACTSDLELRREVESLLARQAQVEGFLSRPALQELAREEPPLLGRQLGPYRVLYLLGRGGMGEVYLAEDIRLGRKVALKLLPAAFLGDADRLRRFEQEARTAGSLNHPNVLTLYDVGTHEGSPYLVSELLEGETLRQQLKGGALPLAKALDFGKQIAQGLVAVHHQGVVHRDLKPENVFVTKERRIKILDFGLAKLRPRLIGVVRTDELSQGGSTEAGVVLGTVGYMSPEQIRGGRVDHRSDLFAFGAILYEMLSGRRAFPGQSSVEVMNAILTEQPPALAGANRNLPQSLEQIVRHCLEKDPEERYQSARDLLFDLQMLAEPSALTGSPGVGRLIWKERVAWTGLGLLTVAILLLTLVYLQRAPTNPRVVRLSLALPAQTTLEVGQFPVLSPDGQFVTFVARDPSGKSQLWLQRLDSLAGQPLPGSEEALYPFWSPDSRWIGYFAQNKLKKIGVGGGPAQTLCDAVHAFGGTWNRDGVIVFNAAIWGLYRVWEDGGPAKPLDIREGSSRQLVRWWPQFLPDGRHFLYSVPQAQAQDRGVYVGSLDSPHSRHLLQVESNAAYSVPGYLLFVRDGTLMARSFDTNRFRLTAPEFPVAGQLTYSQTNPSWAFSVSQTGVLAYLRAGNLRQLVWFDREGQELGPAGAPEAYGKPSLSPDGRTLAVTNFNPQMGSSDIWLLDLPHGGRSRFTLHPESDVQPIWSPDGGSIVFGSPRQGMWDLYRKPTSGSGEDELLLKTGENKLPTSWSRDGRFICYTTENAERSLDQWVLPLSGDRQPTPVVQTPFADCGGQFSPDGRWLAYFSNESGRWEVYVRTFPSPSGRWQVSTGGGVEPRWRGDGKELFYRALDGRLMAVAFKADSRFEIRAIKPLFQMRLAMDRDSVRYAVAADGQRFLINTPAGDATNPFIAVVLNWAAELPR